MNENSYSRDWIEAFLPKCSFLLSVIDKYEFEAIGLRHKIMMIASYCNVSLSDQKTVSLVLIKCERFLVSNHGVYPKLEGAFSKMVDKLEEAEKLLAKAKEFEGKIGITARKKPEQLKTFNLRQTPIESCL